MHILGFLCFSVRSSQSEFRPVMEAVRPRRHQPGSIPSMPLRLWVRVVNHQHCPLRSPDEWPGLTNSGYLYAMNTFESRFFYLFREGDDIKIHRMKEVEAMKLRDKGQRFLDKAQETLAEAEHLRSVWLP